MDALARYQGPARAHRDDHVLRSARQPGRAWAALAAPSSLLTASHSGKQLRLALGQEVNPAEKLVGSG